MGKITTLIFLSVTLVSSYVAYQLYQAFRDTEAPHLPEQFWGPSATKSQKEDNSIRPFKIAIDEKVLSDLKNRLKLELTTGNRLTKPYENIGFEYGFNNDYLKTMGQYWLDKYDWKQREKLLNRYPHFKTKMSGIDIHFQHVKSSNNKKYKTTRPLLLLHGWPGSFVEFQKIIPMLTDPANSDMNFELVIPSLPGYGFSEGGARPGLGPPEMGQLFVKLMKRLGHEKFYVQGGDWGSIIGSSMAAMYPENVIGLHLNFCMVSHPKIHLRRFIASFYPQMFMSAEEEEEYYPFAKFFAYYLKETGYLHLQWSKPDTVGVGLSNSPLGLAAYLVEKFATWTDPTQGSKQDGGVATLHNMDDLLDDVMIYWVTNSITTSVRLYAEGFSVTNKALDSVPVKVPTACFAPKHEFYDLPEYFLIDKFPNLVSYTRGKSGGHFTAFEIPDVLSEDVVAVFNGIEKSRLSQTNNKKSS